MAVRRIRVVVVDDHAVVREGVRATLLPSGMEIVAEAETGEGALVAMERHVPDVVVMDLGMPVLDGASALRMAAVRRLPGQILVFTGRDGAGADALLREGARGFLHKSCAVGELIHAVERVHAGHTYVGAGLRARPEPAPSLTRRELEVLELIVRGLRNREIAERLALSPRTVESHRASLRHKLAARTPAELTRYALDLGLLAPRWDARHDDAVPSSETPA